jgi:hypothetical protein
MERIGRSKKAEGVRKRSTLESQKEDIGIVEEIEGIAPMTRSGKVEEEIK